MLAAVFRLRKSSDFSRIYKHGKKQDSPHLRISFLPQGRFKENVHQNQSCFGFVVSKKHALKIAVRNRQKRLLREAVRKILPQVKDGHLIIIQPRPGMNLPNLLNLQKELQNLLQKAKLLK